MAKPFDAITTKDAAKILAKVEQVPPEVGGLTFHGKWRGRRLRIDTIQPVYGYTASISKDFVVGTLTLSREILSVAEDVVREMRSFGGSIARRAQTGDFDVVTGFDNETHIVAAGHHIALCGHRGPWPDDTQPALTPATCTACEKASKTHPLHRARLHPLGTGKQPSN
jgi:hypothetical protein